MPFDKTIAVDKVAAHISTCYNFDLNSVENICSGTNKVFKVKHDNQNFYLRVSERGFDYVSGELHWIEYLKNYIRVPELVISKNSKMIETFNYNGKELAICMFHELPGVKWSKRNPSMLNEKRLYNWGKTMGCMHCLTKNYNPPKEMRRRPRFEEHFNPLDNYRAVSSLQAKMGRIQNEISSLPKDLDSYGLIHCDMHQQNILFNDNEIGVLDFDECQYGWFALDIGIASYHVIWWNSPENIDERYNFSLGMIKAFMSGYTTENTLSDFWIEKILLFMQYRQIQAFSWHIGVYKSNGFTAVVYNETFGIYFDFGKYIKQIEGDVFIEGCTICKKTLLDAVKQT